MDAKRLRILRTSARLAALCSLTLPLALARPAFTAETRLLHEFSLRDAAGELHTAEKWAGKSALVFFVLGVECPAANGYAPEMSTIAAEYGKRGVIFYGLQCEPSLTPEDAEQHAQEFGLSFPILLDPEQTVARQLGATRTATAVVAAPDGQVLYCGRINDRYPALGKRRDEPTTRELKDMIEAALAGKKPALVETTVTGCPLPKLRQVPAATAVDPAGAAPTRGKHP